MSDHEGNNSNEIERIVIESGVILDLEKLEIKIIKTEIAKPVSAAIRFENSNDLDIYEIK